MIAGAQAHYGPGPAIFFTEAWLMATKALRLETSCL